MYAEDEDHDEVLPVIEEPADGTLWPAPARLEERLYQLCRKAEADQAYEYLRLVATEGLYRPVPLDVASKADGPPPLHAPALADGRRLVQVYTTGVLPRPHRDVVYDFITLGGLAAIWPDSVEILVINAATPCEQWLSADAEEREIWQELSEELFRPDELCDRIDTRRTGAPTDEAMLRGLACGAHLCYANGDPWNTLNWHGAGYRTQVEMLAESWNVSGRADWQGVQQRLLDGQVSPWPWEFVLAARNHLVDRQDPAALEPARWRSQVEAAVREQVTGTGAELKRLVAFTRELVDKVLRYEARFRSDGLLPPDGYVRTIAAWDLGRASGMARWGRASRYATEAEMHAALLRAGQGTQAAYRSWEEFSAGYILGRCLHFDEGRFGDWYLDVLRAHRALCGDPESPWATVPLRP
jgi:hypothetical protein